MVVKMTRKEYEAKYGVAPVLPKPSDIDTTPAPRRMTREEYLAEFFPTEAKKVDPNAQKIDGINIVGGAVGEAINNVRDSFEERKRQAQETDQAFAEGKIGRTQQLASNVGQVLSAGLGSFLEVGRAFTPKPIRKVVGGAFNLATEKPTEALTEALAQPIIEMNESATSLADTANKFRQLAEGKDEAEKSRLLGLAERYDSLAQSTKDQAEGTGVKMAEDAKTAEGVVNALSLIQGGQPKTYMPAVKDVATLVEKVPKLPAPPAPPKGLTETPIVPKAVRKVASEIERVENAYVKTRKINNKDTKAANESRLRVAESGVLDGVTDADGLIRTKQKGGAADAYYDATLKGNESIVRDHLIRENKKINLAEVERELTLAADKIFEGSDLVSALTGIKREVAGLRLRADELGNINLSKIHDAKINKTQQIDYVNDKSRTILFRKTVARVYKELVENNSQAKIKLDGKDYSVADVNRELGKYYTDVERIRNLDGGKVKGGRLGKYTAQISGNIIGAAAGAVGGAPGAALGGILGGEVASAIQGKIMSRNFKAVSQGKIPKNQLLEAARKQAKLPAEQRSPSIPDLRVGAPKDVPKTKQILQLEKQIDKNVRQQQAAIKAGDFTLVQKLKVVYDALVSKLKDVIKKVKEEYKKIPNKQGGFVRIGKDAQEYNLGNRNTMYANTSTKNKNVNISQSNNNFGKKATVDNSTAGKYAAERAKSMVVTNFPKAFEKQAQLLVNEMAKRKLGGAHVDPEGVLYQVKKDLVEFTNAISSTKEISPASVDPQRFFNKRFAEVRQGKAPVQAAKPQSLYKLPELWEKAVQKLTQEMKESNYKSAMVDPEGMAETIRRDASDFMERMKGEESAAGLKTFFEPRFKEVRSHAKSQPRPQYRAKKPEDIERNPDLTGADSDLQEASIKYAWENEEQILADNITKNNGIPVINTDDFRPYFKGIGYNGNNSAAVHAAAKYLSDRARTEALIRPRGESVVSFAGGSGAGKSTVVKNSAELSKIKDEATAVLDGNFSDYESTISKIREIRMANQNYVHNYIYRDFLDSVINGVVDRMFTNADEMGRVVPNKITAENHFGSWEVARRLHLEGLDGLEVTTLFADNSLGLNNSRVVSFEELTNKINYPSIAELKRMADEAVTKIYEKGEYYSPSNKQRYVMTEEQYRSFIE